MTNNKEGETGTCRQACVVGLIKWKRRHVSSADWLRDSMWKVPVTKTCGPIYKN